MRSEEKMVGVHAGWIVASVANEQLARIDSKQELVGKAVSAISFSGG
jgi:hypothetical protein